MTTIATSLERCTLITMHERATHTVPQADGPPGNLSHTEEFSCPVAELLDLTSIWLTIRGQHLGLKLLGQRTAILLNRLSRHRLHGNVQMLSASAPCAQSAA